MLEAHVLDREIRSIAASLTAEQLEEAMRNMDFYKRGETTKMRLQPLNMMVIDLPLEME
jgi:hypothetical protein